MNPGVSRRGFLGSGGSLLLSFSLRPGFVAAQAMQAADPTPPSLGSLSRDSRLDSWIRIGADGSITVFTGKAELGQGIKTALIQVAAEELAVDPARIALVTADTGRTPDEGYTAGSLSMQDSGTAVMNAAAQVRALLIELAASRFGVAPDRLAVDDGVVRTGDGRSIRYGELVTARTLHVTAKPRSALGDARARLVMGRSMRRVDIPAKLTGNPIYVQDVRFAGIVHARVVRPPSQAARLRSLDTAGTERMPGVLKIVRDGSYVAVVAQREYQAIAAMRVLARGAAWDEPATLPGQSAVYDHLRRLPAEATVVHGGPSGRALEPDALTASYRRPYQMHGAIGPSCAVGLHRDGFVTVWTHSQGVYPLRAAIAEMLRVAADRVRCIHVEGSGCYGHNGADDAAADAALIAFALPGRPVRVQWMCEDEHAWEPYGSAMVSRASARLDAGGNVTDWRYEVWSHAHATRPGPAGNLAPARHLQRPFTAPPPRPIPQPAGGGDRNAIPLYRFQRAHVVSHFVPTMPLRVSALRSLGAYMNVFSIESFMDELARAARADPVAFRLRHLDDPRAKEAVAVAAERFGWSSYQARPGRGRGFGFARYKNLAAYTAIACEAEVDRDSGRVRVVRAVAANDSGEAVNPDGIRNQIEGGIIQSISWTLHEAVTFDTTRVTSVDWASYPMIRFPDLPDSVDVHLIDRPGQPFLGTGEAAQGPTAAAVANAVADATGVRIRELPLSRSRVRAALRP
jgi:nicotinate dehydrogenase subunit B